MHQPRSLVEDECRSNNVIDLLLEHRGLMEEEFELTEEEIELTEKEKILINLLFDEDNFKDRYSFIFDESVLDELSEYDEYLFELMETEDFLRFFLGAQ